MSNLSKAIEAIGRDIGEIKGKQSSSLSISQAYGETTNPITCSIIRSFGTFVKPEY